MTTIGKSTVAEILKAFELDSDYLVQPIKITELAIGRINRTFLIEDEAGTKKYLLQSVNSNVFKEPEAIINNYLQIRLHLQGQEYPYHLPEIVKTKNGEPCHIDSDTGSWRLMEYLDNYSCYEQAVQRTIASAARVLGHFHAGCAGFNPGKLNNHMADFHNLRNRFITFKMALVDADAERKDKAQFEIEYLEVNQRMWQTFKPEEHSIRVIHADLKFNNFLFADQEAVALVDYDTIMPGSLLLDFGDFVRNACNINAEDAKKIQPESFNLKLFLAACKEYIPLVKDILSDAEKKLFAQSITYMSYMLAIRFLTDYLQGDRYFPVSYPKANLHRARVQIALMRDVSIKSREINEIVDKLL